MDANKHIFFHYTPLGKNVTIENTANGRSATLQADVHRVRGGDDG